MQTAEGRMRPIESNDSDSGPLVSEVCTALFQNMNINTDVISGNVCHTHKLNIRIRFKTKPVCLNRVHCHYQYRKDLI
jgi:hypothetical protein